MQMKINIEVKSLVKSPPAIGFIKRVAAAVIEEELKDKSVKGEIELSVAFVSAREICKINKKYRKIDRATDVLSFAGDDLGDNQSDHPRMMGELIVCSQIVKSDAQKSGVSEKFQMGWVIIHGILHLLGYDHEMREKEAKEMREKERYYLRRLS